MRILLGSIVLLVACGPPHGDSVSLTIITAGTGSGTVVSSPTGIACGATCTASFAAGSRVTLVATPSGGSNGSVFDGWSGDCSGPSTTTTVEMSAVRYCTATFRRFGTEHLGFPQMPGHGEPPLSKLQLVTVTFGNYPHRSFVESFGDFVVGSHWLTEVTRDFAAIAATHLAKVNLPATAAGSDYGAIVLANIGAALPYPADPTGLVYLFYQPAPCTGGGGFHSSVMYKGKPVAFAVALNCGDGKSAEAVATHEIAEVLTDPYGKGEWFDSSSAPWTGEVGDICNDSPWWMEGGFRFTAIWSNKAAAAGHSPCVPFAADQPYRNVSPSPSEPQTVAAGGSVRFTLLGWSTAAVDPWDLYVDRDNYAQQDFDTKPTLSKSTINDGESVELTLHVPAGTPAGATAVVRVHSALPDQVDGVGGFSGDWSLQVTAK